MGQATETTLAQLLLEAIAGQHVALGPLLEGYRHYLTILARVQLDRALQVKLGASDIVQETFLEAHRDFPHFRGQSVPEFLGWLRQILARNLANQVRRYRQTRSRDIRLEQSIVESLGHSSEHMAATLPAAGLSPVQFAVRDEAAVILANALGQLPPDYRDVLVYRNLEELTFPEVAERMNRSVDSVKKLWVRGLVQLKGLLPKTL
ncbi:sigma-70 family RNA polymerase sigma factor [Limnoglobus roseus]|uniref:RNA polymerase subunit sigma-24 n=1 Tax=Limnoglobus roseus TaxID=2598579 RepID=A0A5C1A6R6_9BACT|nr:sigma-70 family RNA polymerase sigma factor [Limnoglobus roseus]QEL13676.1 RNA polymerase subunit sigma-24 [Limnoglobus roseus]